MTNTGRFPVKASLSVRHPLPDPAPLPTAAAAPPPASPRAAQKGGKAAKAAVPLPPPAPLPQPLPIFGQDVTVPPCISAGTTMHAVRQSCCQEISFACWYEALYAST